MITLIITAYKEPKTIGRTIKTTTQNLRNYELLALCPDEETAKVIKKFAKKNKSIKYLRDEGKGKPSALNLAFSKAKGEIFVLTDGDVFTEKNAVKNILKHFEDKKVGAVSGRPVPTNSRDNMFGYWAHLLTEAGAHKERLKRDKKNEFLVCSGYLYAIRKGIVKKIPSDALSDDAIISHLIWKAGYKTKYEPKAKVFVKYPDNFKDWIKQKRRSAGGYHQIKKMTGETSEMRSFSKEAFFGWYEALKYAKSMKEFFWTLMLFFARIYLWSLTYYDLLAKKSFSKIWERIESTK